jgi:hypothetical protein
MTKRENRCADCRAKFGLVVHRHGRLKFLPQGVEGQLPGQAPARQGSDEGLARLT